TLLNLGICALLVWLYRRKRFTGQVLVSYLVLYSVYRFGVEFLRKGVTAQVMVMRLTQAQVASLAVIVLAGGVLVWMWRRHERRSSPGPSAPGGEPAPEREPELARLT